MSTWRHHNPQRPDGSFDFAISEYGAALWAGPYQWIYEPAF